MRLVCLLILRVDNGHLEGISKIPEHYIRLLTLLLIFKYGFRNIFVTHVDALFIGCSFCLYFVNIGQCSYVRLFAFEPDLWQQRFTILLDQEVPDTCVAWRNLSLLFLESKPHLLPLVLLLYNPLLLTDIKGISTLLGQTEEHGNRNFWLFGVCP